MKFFEHLDRAVMSAARSQRHMKNVQIEICIREENVDAGRWVL